MAAVSSHPCCVFAEMKEKTPGRRRSTSRRKSNTNPEPDPEPDPEPCLEHLSPVPDPDPEPPEFSPGQAPNTEDEENTSTTPSASPPVPSPVREPPVGLPPLLDPDQGPSVPCSPTPTPGPEEDRPSLSSPVPLEVACNPSMEMEGGGASPIEQSLALSPCSSPLVSPCPQLEDEDSLSPLFQRCLSEDSGGSPTLSLGHTNRW